MQGRPSTRHGRRALELAGAGLILQPLTALLVNALSFPSAVGALSALGLLGILAGGVFAVVAVARHGERSVLVLGLLALVVLLVLFLIGEFAFPH